MSDPDYFPHHPSLNDGMTEEERLAFDLLMQEGRSGEAVMDPRSGEIAVSERYFPEYEWQKAARLAEEMDLTEGLLGD